MTANLKDYFAYFLDALFNTPTILMESGGGSVLLGFFLILAITLVFLWDRWLKKTEAGFATKVLHSFLFLSLAVLLLGFLISIPALVIPASDGFVIVMIGTPGINLVLAVIVALGNRLRKNHPIAGTLLLLFASVPFAWILVTTFAVFILRIYNN